MKQEQVIELAKQSGFSIGQGLGQLRINGYADDLARFVYLVEQATLERVAQHFDDRGKYKDGSWSDGFYEPQEPGQIIRNLLTKSQLPKQPK